MMSEHLVHYISLTHTITKVFTDSTRPEGLLDPKIRDEMSDFLEIFPTENQI